MGLCCCSGEAPLRQLPLWRDRPPNDPNHLIPLYRMNMKRREAGPDEGPLTRKKREGRGAQESHTVHAFRQTFPELESSSVQAWTALFQRVPFQAEQSVFVVRCGQGLECLLLAALFGCRVAGAGSDADVQLALGNKALMDDTRCRFEEWKSPDQIHSPCPFLLLFAQEEESKEETERWSEWLTGDDALSHKRLRWLVTNQALNTRRLKAAGWRRQGKVDVPTRLGEESSDAFVGQFSLWEYSSTSIHPSSSSTSSALLSSGTQLHLELEPTHPIKPSTVVIPASTARGKYPKRAPRGPAPSRIAQLRQEALGADEDTASEKEEEESEDTTTVRVRKEKVMHPASPRSKKKPIVEEEEDAD